MMKYKLIISYSKNRNGEPVFCLRYHTQYQTAIVGINFVLRNLGLL